MQFAQLVCEGCRRVLTYPLGAISCRCRNCDTINAAQNLRIPCPGCTQLLLVPINTLTLLCPCCATVTDIPEEFLPTLEEPVDLGGHDSYHQTKTIYVAYPTLRHTSEPATSGPDGTGEKTEGSGSSSGSNNNTPPLTREEQEANDAGGQDGAVSEHEGTLSERAPTVTASSVNNASLQRSNGGGPHNTVVIATRLAL